MKRQRCFKIRFSANLCPHKEKERALKSEALARTSEAESALSKAKSQASSASMRYFALKRSQSESDEEFSERKRAAFQRASDAIDELKRQESI